jgi:hypothetical protein
MQKQVEWLWVFGFFGWFAAANAQTPSPPAANTQFDGTYAFVSGTKVDETYAALGTNRIGQCPERRVGSLVIVKGQARLPPFEGTAGPQGELMMRNNGTPLKWGDQPGDEWIIYGRIGGNGTIRARETRCWCRWDLTWQKMEGPSFPQFDGTYTFVSSTKVNETDVNRVTEQIGQCPELGAGTLTIINGQAYLPIYAGAVGSHGELTMRRLTNEGIISGRIDKVGTVKARKTVGYCSYDIVWQKESE